LHATRQGTYYATTENVTIHFNQANLETLCA